MPIWGLMASPIRDHCPVRSRQHGFTLVELLIVMLILGLIAAIAIPSFFSQRNKANDADAKSTARAAQTAIETYATEHDDGYTGADSAALAEIEAVLPPGAPLAVLEAGPKNYSVTVTSFSETVFSISRLPTGTVLYECDAGGEGGCPAGGDWG